MGKRGVGLVLGLCVAAACGGKEKAAGGEGKAAAAAGGEDGKGGAVETIAVETGEKDWFDDMWKAEKDKRPPVRPEPGKISVVVRDLQLHHPFSKDRQLMSATDDTKTSKDYRFDAYGVGMILEATNDTGITLDRPFLFGHIDFVTPQGKAGCTFSSAYVGYRATHLTADPAAKVKWKDESYAGYEAMWRPGETVRLMVRSGCGHLALLDHGVSGVTIEVVVLGPLALVDDKVLMSERLHLELPGSAALLEEIELPDGSRGFVSGDVVVHASDKGAPVWDSLSKLLVSADKAKRKGLPAGPPSVSGQDGTLSYSAAGWKLTQWADQKDVKDVKKGQRALELTFELAIDTSAIEAQLQSELDTARSEADTAAASLTAAQGKLDVAEGEDAAAAKDELTAAKNADKAAQARLKKAEGAFVKGMTSERGRLAKALSCDKISLVTNAGLIAASNKGEAAAACKALVGEDKVTFVLVYKLGRYELPVALSFAVSGVNRLQYIASQSLSAIDPR